ncbi:MAG: glutathione peroxidase [Pseudomonadota bacterium]
MTGSNAYDFSFTSIDGDELPLSQFEGKAVLVVNTASRCGFTPQYAGLQELYDSRSKDGIVVLGVPSGDFAGQELATEGEIKEFCEVQFGINFPMTEKSVVKGKDAHPFYQWAAQEFGRAAVPGWNFHKIVIAADGTVSAAFPSGTTPSDAKLNKALDEALLR